jgi:hypothetical protein
MRQEEFWMAVVVCVGGVIVLKRLAAWHGDSRKLRARRFDLLAESLRDPSLDQATRAELLRTIARDHHGVAGWLWQRLQSPVLWRTLWFGTGWMGLLLSGAYLAMGVSGAWGWRWHAVPGVMALVFAFGMLTLPLALRELARREHAPGR